jgi:hypothetical protein
MGDDADAGDLFEALGDWGGVSGAAGANENPPVGCRRVGCAPSIAGPVEQRLRRAVRATTRDRPGR